MLLHTAANSMSSQFHPSRWPAADVCDNWRHGAGRERAYAYMGTPVAMHAFVHSPCRGKHRPTLRVWHRIPSSVLLDLRLPESPPFGRVLTDSAVPFLLGTLTPGYGC